MKMTESKPLTDDQKMRVKTTLNRIRSGLKAAVISQFDEPVHVFIGRAKYHAKN